VLIFFGSLCYELGNFDQKMGPATFWVIFFAKSSGHPAADLPLLPTNQPICVLKENLI
jgi:hypothetical protein